MSQLLNDIDEAHRPRAYPPQNRRKGQGYGVTGSREHAVRYKLGFDKYIKDKGYSDVKSLVAFSGEITLKEFADKKFTEVGMNQGVKELA